MVAVNNKQQGSGGSALKRLKKSLQVAGVVGQTSKASRSKKDRKRGNPTEVGKNDADKKLSLIRGEFNPFENKVQKQKFEILGRKVKGSSGKPTLSKQIGEENRKKTLLQEMKNKHRRGGIIDKRFGENNPSLTPEERMLERFTKEKQRASKGSSLFNLDDDDDEFSLTHYGQSLANMDDFDDAGLGFSDDEGEGRGGQMEGKIVSRMHFGGFGDDEEQPEEDRHKSKSEVMKEIIAKSKMHKLERQTAKQEDEELRENLDNELDDIRGLLETKPARKPLPSQTSLFKKEIVTSTGNGEEEKKDSLNDYSDYDKALHELAMDQRAKASDRTKTEEELAMEEKEKLEKAERARKRRMEGLDSEDEDDEPKHKHHHKKRKGAAPQGDDLEDDYLEELEEEVERLGKGLTLEDIQGASGSKDDEDDDEDEDDEDDEMGDDEDDDDDEEEEEDDEELETDNEDLESDDEVPVFGDDDDDDMNEIGNAGVVKKSKVVKPTKQTEKKEVPYTFECPTAHSELLEILQDLEVEDAVLVTKRIRVLYHIKLAPENKDKISAFLGVLVDHIAYIASTVSPLPTTVIDKLNMHAFEIAQQLPAAAASVFTDKLKAMHSNMNQKMKFSASSWPDIEDMALLRLLGQIFSTSDLTHPIATPAMLFMCQALSQCPIQNEIDLGRGLFLTLIAHEYQSFSKRFVPEALNFLNRSLVLLAPKNMFNKNVPGYFPTPESANPLPIELTDDEEIENIRLDQLAAENIDEQDNNKIRLSLLQATVRMFERYLTLYASTPALVEVFEDALQVVSKLMTAAWQDNAKTLLETLQGRLERQIKFAREKRTKTPLRMQQHRPIPIAQHLPKFEKAYSVDRHYDPDHERSQLHKLEAQVKKEKKGALRELRKDNQFIARERAKERKQKDDDYNKMLKGVMTILEGEQSEKNRIEREKGKK